ncbi:MAG TPA: PCRF domain-containing protein, partial [Nitratifractor sp.]|nr:PCRF domain-containing protein [Nitratifractor sp.]
MDSYEYGELLKTLQSKMSNITDITQPKKIEARLNEIEEIQQNPEFWNNAKEAAKVSQEKTKLERILSVYNEANDALNDAIEYFELAKSENDEDTLEMLFEDAEHLKEEIQKLEIQIMLSGEHDSNSAIVSIHPGAGGTESQDWASMLY